MENNRVEGMAKGIAGVNGAAKVTKRPASPELVLAAQVHQLREQVLALRRTVAEQEQVIAQLQAANYTHEAQKLDAENAALREKFGLKTGQRLEQDEKGGWVIVEEEKAS